MEIRMTTKDPTYDRYKDIVSLPGADGKMPRPFRLMRMVTSSIWTKNSRMYGALARRSLSSLPNWETRIGTDMRPCAHRGVAMVRGFGIHLVVLQ